MARADGTSRAQSGPTAADGWEAPAVTVMIVSDYVSSDESQWEQMRRVLRAVASQDFNEPAEYILVENADTAARMPADLPALLPALQVVPSGSASSYAMKNEGARLAKAPLLAVLDADCVPAADWLRHLVGTMRRHPEAAVVNSSVSYAGRSRLERLLGLVDRSFLNQPATADTTSMTPSSTGIRRDVLLAHPLPDGDGPFYNKMYAQHLIRLGHRVLFEPKMRTTHDFEGWSFEVDLRRNVGYSAIAMRRADPQMPGAWLTRLGYASIPPIVLAKIGIGLWTSARFARTHGVAWYEVPMAWAIIPVIRCMEIPGMVVALRGGKVDETAFR